MNRADRCSVRTCWSFGVTQTNQFLGEVWVNERGQRISRPLTPRRSWLRGLDLNQRPLGYELCHIPSSVRHLDISVVQNAAGTRTTRNPPATARQFPPSTRLPSSFSA